MKSSYIAIFLIIQLSIAPINAGKKINTDFLNLISNKSNVKSSQDAIQSVFNLLQDLQGANEEAQQKADATFAAFETSTLADINDFSGMVNVDSKSVSAAQQDLDGIDLKLVQTTDYLNWNQKRFQSNQDNLQLLAEQRCEGNSLFIDTLREYKSALAVLDWVKSSVGPNQNAFVEKKKVGEYAEKLSKYANLFEEQAISNFVKLGEEEVALSQLNEQGKATDLAELLVKDIVSLVSGLIDGLRDAIKGLEEQEIQSANDFADYKTNILGEQQSLKQENEAKSKFLNSLNNDRELAFDILTKKKEIQTNSMTILSLTQDQYNDKKSSYATEKVKRHEENQLLEEALAIYKSKITTVGEYLKKRVNEYIGDSLIEEKTQVQFKAQENVGQRKFKTNLRFNSEDDE